MRTTISIPDDLFVEARRLAGESSFSDFASEAIRFHVHQLERERLARDMEEGYRAEAECPSLDEEWATVEADGL
jgi:predicted CopG family antitoxin